MNFKLIFGFLLLFLSSCSVTSEKKDKIQKLTDPNVKNQLQGTWLDKNTESPVLHIEGDSLFYVSKSDVLMPYKLIDDTLFVYGVHTSAYPITERTEHTIAFITPMGDEMCLYKDEQENVIIEMPSQPEKTVKEKVTRKDSVIMCKNTRFRGYVTINPTTIKVIRPGVTEDGFSVDNVYFDNIIHICVYEGKKQLCGKDIKRDMFKSVVPNEFLSVSILEDMDFIGVKNDSFVFHSMLRVPDGPCYYANLVIDRNDNIEVRLID